MRKRILSLLTALVLCLGLLPVTAGAAETPTMTGPLKLQNYLDGGGNASEGWKWEVTGDKRGTLTLTNCYITNPQYATVIEFPGGWTNTIVLDGHNILETQKPYYNSMLTGVPYPGNPYPAGSDGNTSFIVKGTGSLDIRCTEENAPTYAFGGKDFTIEGGEITANVSFCTINGVFTMSGGSLTVKNQKEDSTGIYAIQGPINISGGTVDLDMGDCGIMLSGIPDPAKAVNISGGTVKTVGNALAGIFVQPKGTYDPVASPQAINITGGTVTGSGGQAGLYARDISISGTETFVEFHGTTLDLCATNAASVTGGAVVLDGSRVGGNPPFIEPAQNCLLLVDKSGLVYGNVVLSHDLTVPASAYLGIPEGTALSVKEGVTLTNAGTLRLAEETGLTGGGTLAGNGTFQLTRELTEDDISVPSLLPYTGEDLTDEAKAAIKIEDTCEVMGQDFTLKIGRAHV